MNAVLCELQGECCAMLCYAGKCAGLPLKYHANGDSYIHIEIAIYTHTYILYMYIYICIYYICIYVHMYIYLRTASLRLIMAATEISVNGNIMTT